MDSNDIITMAHGSGGGESAHLLSEIFGKHFSNEILDRFDDAAVLPIGGHSGDGSEHSGDGSFCVPQGTQKEPSPLCSEPSPLCSEPSPLCSEPSPLCSPLCPLVVSTDSFVVTPLFFPGGDIGKLAVCGSVNDVLMMGAVPRWLTCGFILEEGLGVSALEKIALSMAEAAKEAGVRIIAGDTKVVEGKRGENPEGGLFINTTAIGVLRPGNPSKIGASEARPGDAIILSGNLGDHHACILSSRLDIANNIRSDCSLLAETVDSLLINDIDVHVMRDVTRGGLATILNEIAAASGVTMELEEGTIPVDDEVRAFCGVMGLDPLYMGNEGKMVAIVAEGDADRALDEMRKTRPGVNSAIIGRVARAGAEASVILRTPIGGGRRLSVLYGEGLPRIC